MNSTGASAPGYRDSRSRHAPKHPRSPRVCYRSATFCTCLPSHETTSNWTSSAASCKRLWSDFETPSVRFVSIVAKAVEAGYFRATQLYPRSGVSIRHSTRGSTMMHAAVSSLTPSLPLLDFMFLTWNISQRSSRLVGAGGSTERVIPAYLSCAIRASLFIAYAASHSYSNGAGVNADADAESNDDAAAFAAFDFASNTFHRAPDFENYLCSL